MKNILISLLFLGFIACGQEIPSDDHQDIPEKSTVIQDPPPVVEQPHELVKAIDCEGVAPNGAQFKYRTWEFEDGHLELFAQVTQGNETGEVREYLTLEDDNYGPGELSVVLNSYPGAWTISLERSTTTLTVSYYDDNGAGQKAVTKNTPQCVHSEYLVYQGE